MSTLDSIEKPFIEHLREQGHLLAIDASAATYLSGHQQIPEEALLLFSFLFAAARLGHLCIRVNQTISPPVEQVWPIEDKNLLKVCLFKMQTGFQMLSENFLKNHPSLRKIGDRLYLQKNEFYEKEIRTHYKKIESDNPSLEYKKIQFDDSLTLEQKKAVTKSLNTTLSFIVGGPGVGKTFTANALIEAFLNLFPKARVSVVAPTGKAIANLQKGLSQLIENQKFSIHTYTLHKLFYKKVHSFLPDDLIIVDEASMVDAYFFLQLLKYCKMGSRLVFLGDPNQLPPIGSGSIFKDLLARCSNFSRLTSCLRTDIKEIISCSELVQKGDREGFFHLLDKKNFYNELTTKNELITHLLSNIVNVESMSSDYQKLELVQKHKILTSMKKGEFGADSINQVIKQLFSSRDSHPIIITSNDYNLDLYNGDVGLLNKKGEAIFFVRSSQQRFVDKDEGVRRVPVALLPNYDIAYCLSIHKSQGSEYEKISIILPPKSEVFGRELLYTAITRAKKEFEIFSDKHTLTKLIKNQCIRLSGLSIMEDK